MPRYQLSNDPAGGIRRIATALGSPRPGERRLPPHFLAFRAAGGVPDPADVVTPPAPTPSTSSTSGGSLSP